MIGQGSGKDDGITHRGADLSEQAKTETDSAIKQIMTTALTEAEELLEAKREHIAILTEALMEKDTVMASELEDLFSVIDIYLE